MTETPISPEVAKAQMEEKKKVNNSKLLLYDLAWKLTDDEVIVLGEFINKYGYHGVVETIFPERRNLPRKKFIYSHNMKNPYIHVERCDKMQDAKRYVLSVELDNEGALPFRIYRRFEVPSNMWMEEFGPLVIEIMGWYNYHLHSFTMDGKVFVSQGQYEDQNDFISEDDDMMEHSYNTMTVADFLKNAGDTIEFMYDYGDAWKHIITLEEMTEYSDDTLQPSVVLDGENACPPEDCGGVYGYAELLEIIADRKHPEYKSYKQWLPRGFKPDVFDVNKQNKKLKKLGF